MTIALDPEGAHLESLERLASFADARVCEVGCGEGRLTAGIAPKAASIFAFDPDADRVAVAQAALSPDLAERVTFRVATAREIEIPRTAFDIVLFSWSL